MSFLEFEHWPLWGGVGILILANVWNQFTGKVPNGLTLPALLGGLALAVVLSLFPKLLPAAAGGIGSALWAVLLGGGAALGLWVAALSPGGCMKMQFAFCAWIGCGVAAGGVAALLSTLGAFVLGAAAFVGFNQYHRRREQTKTKEPDSRPLLHLQTFASLGAVAGLIAGRYLGFI